MSARKSPGAIPAIMKIYNNLVVMIETYRNAEITTKLSAEQVDTMLNMQHFATISAKRIVADPNIDPRGSANILVALTAPQQEIETNSPKFTSFLEGLIRNVSEQSGAIPCEIILVTEKPLSSANSKRTITRSRETKVRIDQYTHDSFALVVPRHSMVPSYRIATKAEVDKICLEYNTCVADFPMMRAGSMPDPIAIWYGLRPGMVVCITSSSETACVAVKYRKCI